MSRIDTIRRLTAVSVTLLLWGGFFSFGYADIKLKHNEYRYEPMWNGVQYSVVVPASQYIFDSSDEAKQAQCSAITLQVREMCLCPAGTSWVRYTLRSDQKCSTGDYYSTYLAGIESVYCTGIAPYAQPDGTCSDTPPQTDRSIDKNLGGCTEGPSPSVGI